jgi:uncharacterized protein (TIGR04255 family)
MLLKQFLKLPSTNHAIKEASISLFFASPFVHAGRLRALLDESFKDEFNQVQEVQGFELRLQGQLARLGDVSASSQKLGPPGIQASKSVNGVVVHHLQVRNDSERVSLSFHNLRYGRWADFLELFEKLANSLSPLLANMVVVAASLHYIDELEWTHPTQPLPLNKIYQENPAYLPGHFFDSSFSELLLTVPCQLDDLNFFDRLHITSLTNNRSVATISHNLVHQFTEAADLPALLEQPNLLKHVLQQAHEHNKTVLRGILQQEIQDLIGLTS